MMYITLCGDLGQWWGQERSHPHQPEITSEADAHHSGFSLINLS
ncbi:hypothetical protein [[Phormidium] sp. ETS-05]|nr:hypothetical protein [[Phormidium] sp. ETS-05]